MEKRERMEKTSSVRDRKKSIDRLPDELLVSIVSALSVKEAIRTSVLARRWRCFWLYNPFLDFDGSGVVRRLKSRRKFVESDRINFVGWVNRVLNLHLNETIDKFRVLFDLDNNYANDIDKWIEFAFKKRVKRLELNMEQTYCMPLDDSKRYTFPNICDPTERSRILPLGKASCASLVSLRLAKVDVGREVVELFLFNCPLLEELHVENADGFDSLSICGEATRLRRLVIINCRHFKGLEICSPYLVSCTCTELGLFTIELEDISSVVNLSLGEISLWELSNCLLDIPECLSRLETLSLQTATMPGDEELEFPTLPRLKKLVLHINRYHGGTLLCFTPLLNAAPSLRKMVLKPAWSSHLMQRRAQRPEKGQEHRCLQVCEIAGFASVAARLEVVLYVLENASSLEKLIIHEKFLTKKDIDLLRSKLDSENCVQDITDLTESMFIWF